MSFRSLMQITANIFNYKSPSVRKLSKQFYEKEKLTIYIKPKKKSKGRFM